MVTHLVDSDVLINFFKAKPEAVALFDQFKDGELGISVITVAEVLEGVVENKGLREIVENELRKYAIFDVDYKIAEVTAEQRSILRKQGKLIENMDLLIASTALTHKLTLITGNRKHFERIKGLKLFNEDFAD